jgi:hypothetical protein
MIGGFDGGISLSVIVHVFVSPAMRIPEHPTPKSFV